MDKSHRSPALAEDRIALIGFSEKLACEIAQALESSHALAASRFDSAEQAMAYDWSPALACVFDGPGAESAPGRLRCPTLVLGAAEAGRRAAEVARMGAIAYYCTAALAADEIADLLAAYSRSLSAARAAADPQRLYDPSASGLGLVEWNRDLVVTRWSTEAEALLGLPKEQAEGREIGSWLMPSDELERFLAGARGLIEGYLGNLKIRCLARRRDGSTLATYWRAAPLREDGESYVAIFEPADGIAAPRAGNGAARAPEPNAAGASAARGEEFEQQAGLLANAVERLAIGVYLKDARAGFAVTVWNAEMERLFQIPKSEIIGRRIEEVFDDPVLQAALCETVDPRSRSRTIMPRPRGEDAPAASFIADISKTPILDERGNVAALIGVVHDVTERIRSENRLVAAFNELEASKESLELSNLEIRRGIEKAQKLAVAAQASNKAKTFFMSNISHELRTPLTSIISLSHALLEKTFGELNPRQDEFLSIISESAQHLQALITDILDLSKIELGKLSLKIAEASISDLATATLRMVAQMARSKRIDCALSIATRSDSIMVDGKRLRQILLNLISNAIKFTKPDTTIRVEIADHPELDACVFSVIDNGIGIKNADMERIFLPFTQIDDSLSKQYEGTGLGLAIVAKLVELHGGSLSVASGRDDGATFSFVLPRQQPAAESFPPGPSLSQVALEKPPLSLAIIVDDNERVAAQLRQAALEAGADQAVVALPTELAAYYDQVRPALLLADLSTVMSQGSDWIRPARAHPGWAGARWAALTSLDIANSRHLCNSLEIDLLLPKPVSAATLRRALENSRA